MDIGLGVDSGFDADHSAVLALARAAQDALCANVGDAAGPRNVARVLLAGAVIKQCNSVEDVHFGSRFIVSL